MKKLLLNTLIGLALLTCQTSFAQKTKAKFSPIKVETPARPANQQDVIQLVTPKLETVRVGFIGLGMRGPGAVERWTHIPGTQIVALCDRSRNSNYFPVIRLQNIFLFVLLILITSRNFENVFFFLSELCGIPYFCSVFAKAQ